MGSGKKILVVDDEKSIRMTVRVCLEAAGYSVSQACDGSQALEAIAREAPDLVILDLAMPVMDGMSVLADIKNLLPHYPVRIIVATAHGSVKTAIEAMRLGASDFLEKPFSPDELRQSVDSVLRDDLTFTSTTSDGYVEVLQHVRHALREGQFKIAERQLMKAGTITGNDAPFLNLAGILHECHGRNDSAKKYYERALACDRNYPPAKENLARLDELKRLGKTKRAVFFGDDDYSKKYMTRRMI